MPVLQKSVAGNVAVARMRQMRISRIPQLPFKTQGAVWSGLQVQSVCIRRNEGEKLRMSNTDKGEKQLVARSFDLTTSAGLTEALRAAKDPDLLLLIGGPIPYLVKKLFDKGAKLIRETANSTNSTINEQRQAAVEIIKAGKDNNVSSLEVILDQKAGIDLGSEVEGIPFKFCVGKSGKMIIKVEYK